MDGASMIAAMEELGVEDDRIKLAQRCGVDFNRWLAGFGDTEKAVRESVAMVREHPVMPARIRVSGWIMDSETGEITQVDC